MSNKGTFQPESDVHIIFEDQQKINRFAKLNAKLSDLKEALKLKENDLKTVEEACEEIELIDDDEKIPYMVGEIFIFQNGDTTKACLENDKKELETEMNNLKKEADNIKDLMSDLKSHLYGKFGSHINLDTDE